MRNTEMFFDEVRLDTFSSALDTHNDKVKTHQNSPLNTTYRVGKPPDPVLLSDYNLPIHHHTISG
jgi:hypothetical protein